MTPQLPYNIEMEQGVLGSMILDPAAIDLVASWLRADDFYRNTHQIIYEAILDLHNRHQPADLIMLCEVLEKQGMLADIGGGSYLASLMSSIPTSGYVENYGQIIVQKANLRRLIHAGSKIVALAYAEDEHAQEQAEQLLFALRRDVARDFLPLAKVLQSCLKDIEALEQQKAHMLGVPTGFRHLDAALGGGLQRADLIILSARPGNGKTSLGLNIAARAALKHEKRIAFFSLEMSAKQLGTRLLAMEANEDQRRLRMGQVDDWQTLVQATNTLSESAIWIDDTAGISLTELRSKARRLQSMQGIDLVIVDYLQLMRAVTANGKRPFVREQEIAEISRGLKELAKELNVPVLALAQLNRSVDYTEQQQEKVIMQKRKIIKSAPKTPVSTEQQAPTKLEPLLTMKEVASILGMSYTKLYYMVRNHEIAVIRHGHQVKFKPQAVCAWIDAHEQGKNDGLDTRLG